MTEIINRIEELGILPVICLPNAETAVPLAEALCKGGIPVIEVTLRRPWALEAIRRIRTAFPKMLIGAGTVLNTAQVAQAQDAGASFIVSPGIDAEVIKYCKKHEIPIVPGCSNATEITLGINLGLKTLKFFPAEINGGIATLSLLHGPFADCNFIPTGGLSQENIANYLDKPYVAACGGSFPAKSADIISGNWDKISENCRKCIDISLGFEFAHIGINHENEESAIQAANAICRLFHLPVTNGNKSLFNAKSIEHIKIPAAGVNGHLGFSTRSVKRALAWYRNNGIAICEETINRTPDGKPVFFTLKEKIGDFALHITQR